MPNLPTAQELYDLKTDANDLAEIVNGDENTLVSTRYGGEKPSVQRAVNQALAQYATINNRGAWTASTTYAVNDIWQHTDDTWYLVLTDYNSDSSDIDVDVASGDVVVYQDATRASELSLKSIDLTGVVDASDTVLAALESGKVITLPAGIIKLDITVPSGCTLVGSGWLTWDRDAEEWTGDGTLVMGRIDLTDSKGCCIGNMSIDSYDLGINCVQGLSDETEHHYIKNVNTRANNHGQLWEQNSTQYSDGRKGGFIIVEDCNHYDGPNGFVTKMRNVTFIRCWAYDVTVQAHVAVSDNINGQGVFSRAINSTFIDCGGERCNEGLRIYARNYHSEIDITAGVADTQWIRGNHSDTNGRQVRTGDFSGGAFDRIISSNLTIDDGTFLNSPFSCIRLEYMNRTQFKGMPLFSGNTRNVEYGSQVFDVSFSDAIKRTDSAPGEEARFVTYEAGETSLLFTSTPELVIFKNTANTVVSLTGGLAGIKDYIVRFLFLDHVTRTNFTGSPRGGYGQSFLAEWNGSEWTVLSETGHLTTRPYTVGYLANLVLDYDDHLTRTIHCDAAGEISQISTSFNNIADGEILSVRLSPSNTGAKSITSWSSDFVFSEENPAPTVIPDEGTLLISFQKSNDKLRCTSINTAGESVQAKGSRTMEVTNNSTVMPLVTLPNVVIFKNTAETNVQTISGLTGNNGYTVTFVFLDSYTRTTFTGSTRGGYGQSFTAHWNGADWVVLGESGQLTTREYQEGYSASVVLDFDTTRAKTIYVAASNHFTLISASIANIPDGETLNARLAPSNAGGKGITDWSSDFVFSTENPAPTVIPSGGELILTFQKVSGVLKCLNINTF
jgi:hypothetical protein